MNEESSHSLLRDYVQTLRRRKWIIVAVMLIGALAAAGITFLQSKSYSAQAALEAQNPAQQSGLVGLLQTNPNLPQETAAQLAQTVPAAGVMTRVKSVLHLPQSIDDIRNNISVSEDQQSNFVLIQGSASTAAGAAALTNAVANAVVDISNTQIRQQFATDAAGQSKQAQQELAPYAGKTFAALTPAQQQAYTVASQDASTLEGVAAKLQALSKVIQVAQVTTPATVPSSPSSPHRIETIIIGAVAGLVIGLLLVWFLESIDRRLRRPDETERLLGMPIIGAITEGGLGTPPGSEKDAAGLAPYRMLRTNVRFLAPKDADPPRTVLVTSGLPEEGKTTVAMGLARAAAAGGLNTLLIEADVHRPVHAKRLGLNTGPGLTEYLVDGLPPERILQVSTFTDASTAHLNGHAMNGRAPKLTCITAGEVGAFSGDALGSQRFAEMLAEVRQVYDLVVIDSAPLLAVAETSEIVSFVDAIVFCVRLGRTTVEQVKAARSALERLPNRLGGLVVTDLSPQLGGYYGYGYGYEYADTKPGGKRKQASAAV